MPKVRSPNRRLNFAKLPFLIEAAESNVTYTLGSMEGKQSAKGALPDNTIAKAVTSMLLPVQACKNC